MTSKMQYPSQSYMCGLSSRLVVETIQLSRSKHGRLSGAPSAERIHELSTDGRKRLVAVDGSDEPIAFIDLEKDGHIHFLYCSPDVIGKGVASAIYDELEKIARECGVSRLYSEASEAARRFFLKKGFVVTSRRQFEISGIQMHNYDVEKALANN
jgi:putative acetyltransferase